MLLSYAALIITKMWTVKKTDNEHHLAKIPAGTEDNGTCHYQ
jgi:hypothetical protein